MASWRPFDEETPLNLSTRRRSPSAENTDVYRPYYASYAVPPPPAVFQYPPPAPTYIVQSPGFLSPASTLSSGSTSEAKIQPFISYSHQAGPSPPITPPDAVRIPVSDDEDFLEFESKALAAMAARNGGALVVENPRMRRVVASSRDSANEAHRRHREKNNLAAKLSRDKRKRREIHMCLKVSYLENKVAMLKAELAACRNYPK